MDKTTQKELATLIDRFSGEDGIHNTAIPGMKCIKLSDVNAQLPTVYTPSVCIITQGKKQVLLESDIYSYAPSQYLAISVDLPVIGMVTEATKDKPYLCLQVELEQDQLAELIAQGFTPPAIPQTSGRGMFVGDVDQPLADATLRLARLLENPRDIPMLAPMIKREIYYRLLSGTYGDTIAQLGKQGSHMQRISTAIHKLKTEYNKPLRVEDMAEWAGMSASSFHDHFKKVTAMSPLQYQKKLRLMEARRIMVAEMRDAASTAYHVGYESATQFSREYARLFGNPPKRDIDNLKAAGKA